MRKLLLSVFVMCAMYESAWSRIERICIAPAGCQIIMNTGECPDCIDKFIPDVITETYEEVKVEKIEEYSDEYLNNLLMKSKNLKPSKGKWKCIIGPCDWIDSNGNLIVKN